MISIKKEKNVGLGWYLNHRSGSSIGHPLTQIIRPQRSANVCCSPHGRNHDLTEIYICRVKQTKWKLRNIEIFVNHFNLKRKKFQTRMSILTIDNGGQWRILPTISFDIDWATSLTFKATFLNIYIYHFIFSLEFCNKFFFIFWMIVIYSWFFVLYFLIRSTGTLACTEIQFLNWITWDHLKTHWLSVI